MSNAKTFVHNIAPDAANRAEHDFYRTGAIAVEKLLAVEKLEGKIWEPACGDGAISRVLEAHGLKVHSTDLIDRGYGTGGVDFLRPRTVSFPTVSCVITNPPFKLAQQFAARALDVAEKKVLLLCRTLWLEGGKRGEFFRRCPPARVWVFSNRIPMQRAGWEPVKENQTGMMSFSWFVWDQEHVGKTELDWL